jgi:hypothetical protein
MMQTFSTGRFRQGLASIHIAGMGENKTVWYEIQNA